VAQELTAADTGGLYYWRSRGGKAELDFLLEEFNEIVPLEVKAGVNPKSKSLASFDQQYSPRVLARTNLLNFAKAARIMNVPLYAVSQLPRLLAGVSER